MALAKLCLKFSQAARDTPRRNIGMGTKVGLWSKKMKGRRCWKVEFRSNFYINIKIIIIRTHYRRKWSKPR